MDEQPHVPSESPVPPPPVPVKSARSFWILLSYGAIATLAASIVNFQIANRLIDPWMSARMLERGAGGSTDLMLGIFLTNLLIFPALQFILCGLVLPALCVSRRRWVDSNLYAAATVLVLAAPMAALWLMGDGLFWIITLPAVSCAVAALLVVIAVARMGMADRRDTRPDRP